MTPFFPIMHGSRNQGVEARVAPLTITPRDSLGDFVLAVLTKLGPAGLEVLLLKSVTLARAHSKGPFNYKLWLPPQGTLNSVSMDLKSKSHHFGRTLKSRERRLHLYSGDREEYARHLLALLCPS